MSPSASAAITRAFYFRDADGIVLTAARLSTTAHREALLARVPLLTEDDPTTPPPARELLLAVGSGRGRVVNLYRALAHHPSALQAFTALGSVVYGRESSLTRKQAELAYTTATVVNNCYY